MAILRKKKPAKVRRKSEAMSTQRLVSAATATPYTNPSTRTLKKERRTKRPNSLMVMWRMMILYVLRDQIRKNEATNEVESHIVAEPAPRMSIGMKSLVARIASKDARNESTISIAKITRVLRYLLTYWLRIFMSLPIMF